MTIEDGDEHVHKRIQLPVVKSKKPGILRLTTEASAELETLLDLSDAR
jgi:hypothetical protein